MSTLRISTRRGMIKAMEMSCCSQSRPGTAAQPAVVFNAVSVWAACSDTTAALHDYFDLTRVRLHHVQSGSPPTPDFGQRTPEETIEGGQFRSGTLPLIGRKLKP